MASIERTAYPRFKRAVTARELHGSFTPSLGEIEWARELTRSPEHLLALVALLKSFQRLGYFPDLYEVPIVVVDHVRGYLDMGSEVEVVHDSDRTAERHRAWIRQRVGVVRDMKQARKLAEQAIYDAVRTKDNPADLINVALEELVRAGLELPGYSTLDDMAARIREEVNAGVHATIHARISDTERGLLVGLLTVNESSRRSRFDDLKRPAGAATLSRFKEHLARLAWMDALGSTASWVADVPAAKVAHFAAEAKDLDAGDMRKLGERKRVVLLACLLHVARIRGGMSWPRCTASASRGCTSRLGIGSRRCGSPAGPRPSAWSRCSATCWRPCGSRSHPMTMTGSGRSPTSTVRRRPPSGPAGRCWRRGRGRRLADLVAAHEQVSAYHGDNYLPFMEKFYRRNRSTLFDLLDVLVLVPTTNDRTVLDAVEFLRRRTGEYIPDHVAGEPVDLSFASEAWLKILRDRPPVQPGSTAFRGVRVLLPGCGAARRRHRGGRVGVVRQPARAAPHLEQCGPLLAEYCAEVGLPTDAAGFVAQLRRALTERADVVNAGFPANADLDIIDGQPVLRRRRGRTRQPSAVELEKTLLSRLPERPILDVLTRTAYRTECFRHSGRCPAQTRRFGTRSAGTSCSPSAMGRTSARTRCRGTWATGSPPSSSPPPWGTPVRSGSRRPSATW